MTSSGTTPRTRPLQGGTPELRVAGGWWWAATAATTLALGGTALAVGLQHAGPHAHQA